MNETAFVERREPDWKRLHHLCNLADASPANLSSADFHDFVRLYRRVSGDLAAVRTRTTNEGLIEFLNDLVARAYGILYRTRRRPFGAAMVGAVSIAADTVRRRRWFVLASAALFVGSAVFSFFLMDRVPDARAVLVPPGMEETFEHWKSGRSTGATGMDAVAMTALYMSNNPLVTILAAAVSAATFGLLTTSIIFNNGAVLGALTYEMHTVGKVGYLYASILPHGVPELSGIVIGGAAGFVLAWALINPGRRKRGEAMKDAGRDAIALLATAVALMFIAAPIEGFFSFNDAVPQQAKVAVIVLEALVWGMFWVGYGRNASAGSADGEPRGQEDRVVGRVEEKGRHQAPSLVNEDA